MIVEELKKIMRQKIAILLFALISWSVGLSSCGIVIYDPSQV
jgi:hypothetical protein